MLPDDPKFLFNLFLGHIRIILKTLLAINYQNTLICE